ncbi:MAG: AAA family ATPase [Spirochaetales bacterium]|nr:AAA family ATPase [Spirochaetales bacterium]
MSEELFERAARPEEMPLAARMRPRTLEEFVGQGHILGQGRLLRRAIQADQLSSLIFYGPPGTGKTTLARVIANTTRSHFESINAVLAGVKEIRAVTAQAEERRRLHGQRTILFVDEVHRWNKAQQDALLPWVENGTVVLIGATTENPFFEVNPALVSRSRVFQLTPLSREELLEIARATLGDPERGYGGLKVEIHPDALEHLVDVAGGDARTLLNALELAVETTPESFPPPPGEPIHVTLQIAEESIQRRAILYDKEGDYHFDTISAFIKSLRGSDPDAALYWMARMVYAGENPRFILRRMLIFAAEDVGLADPNALAVAEAAAAAFDRVGLPEGRFHLAQAALYLATAPKSNTTLAFFDALKTVEEEQSGEVPPHLKDSSRDKEGFGHGQGYLYPHAYRDHWVAQQYLPDRLQGKVFYHPSDQGREAEIREAVERRREAQLAAMLESEERGGEVLTFSPPDRARELWLERTVSRVSEQLAALREELFASFALARHHLVLDLNARGGLLTWEAARRVPEGGVWAVAGSPEEARLLETTAAGLPELERPRVLQRGLGGRDFDLPALLAAAGEPELRFDLAIGRDALLRESDREAALRGAAEALRPGGGLALAETIPAAGRRLSEALDLSRESREFTERLEAAEARIYRNPADPLTCWDEQALLEAVKAAGFAEVRGRNRQLRFTRMVRQADLERWFARPRERAVATASERGRRAPTGPPAPPPSRSYGEQAAEVLAPEELERLEALCREQLQDRAVEWFRAVVIVAARKPA